MEQPPSRPRRRPRRRRPLRRRPLTKIVNDQHTRTNTEPVLKGISISQSSDHQPPATDPDETRLLWTQVHLSKWDMAGLGRRGRAGAAIKARGGRAGRGLTGRGGLGSLVADEQVPPSSSVPGPDLVSQPSCVSKNITIRNASFQDHVLRPRRILIEDVHTLTSSAFLHFHPNADPLSEEDNRVDYHKLEGLGTANIWLPADPEWIQTVTEEYMAMTHLDLCEEEFATYAKETLLRSEPRSVKVPEDRHWRPERMLQLVAIPDDGRHWRKPPILDEVSTLDGSEVKWSFDVRPDCSYWLSLRGFNPKYRHKVQDIAYVVKRWITCPYLTVEFKQSSQTRSTALWQVAVAGAMALYNRYRLRNDALKVAVRDWQSDDLTPIRHYGFTAVGAEFEIWILKMAPLDGDGSWTGCTMNRLVSFSCAIACEVHDLVSWTNEIHHWGLSEHAASCEHDIKTILRAGGIRTSLGQSG